MSEVLQANVFFLITSIAIVVFTVLLCIALYYVIKILKSVQKITERIEEGSNIIAQDVATIRKNVISGVTHGISVIFGSIRKFSKKKTSRRKSSSKNKTNLQVTNED